jgi:hypothetical protein
MLYIHSVIYHQGLELTALLNNAFQRMHSHDCRAHPENKFVKFTYAVEKTFDQVTKTHSFTT